MYSNIELYCRKTCTCCNLYSAYARLQFLLLPYDLVPLVHYQVSLSLYFVILGLKLLILVSDIVSIVTNPRLRHPK